MATPDPARLVTPSSLTTEVAPWGRLAPSIFMRRRGADPLAIIPDTDPYARLGGQTSAEFYGEMMAWSTPASYGVNSVKHSMLSQGFSIEKGKAPGQDPVDLRDWTAAWLSQRELRLPRVLDLWANYPFYGWGLFQVLWHDWTWVRGGAVRRRARTFKVPRVIIDKDTREFQFNLARDLVWSSPGMQRVYPISTGEGAGGETARMQWQTPSWGSGDLPYGRSVLRTSGTAAAYLLWRDLQEQWQRGVDRSMGILLVEKVAGQLAANMSDAAFESELENVIQFMNSTGILKPPEGMRLRWMENTAAYAEGWKDPLDRLEAWLALSTTGQALSIGLGRAAAGSRAAAEVEAGRTDDWAQRYARDLSDTLGALFDTALEWNWGSVPDDMRPKIVFRSTRQIIPERLRVYVQMAEQQPDAPPPDWALIADDLGIPTNPAAEWGPPVFQSVPQGGETPSEVSSEEDEDDEASTAAAEDASEEEEAA